MYPLAQFVNRPGWSEFTAYRANAYGQHRAYDYYAPIDSVVRAPKAGTVIGKAYNGNTDIGYGHNITIDFGGGLVGTYAHFGYASPKAVWSTVAAGETIGLVGNTGNATGVYFYTAWNGVVRQLSHCHEALELNGVRIDPRAHWGTSSAGDIGTPILNEKEDNTMLIIDDINPAGPDGGYLSGPGRKLIVLPNVNDRKLMQRYIDGETQYTFPEIKIIEAYLVAFAPQPVTATFDVKVVTDAVNAAIKAGTIPASVIADAVADEQADRLDGTNDGQ